MGCRLCGAGSGGPHADGVSGENALDEVGGGDTGLASI
jgi:hypothetical protein